MRLAEARAKKLLSVRDLAQKAGMSPQGVHSIEAGKWLPTLRTVAKLTEALALEDPTEVDEFRAAMEKTAQGKKDPARTVP